jgi:flagellar assembly factor FliW
MNQEILFIREIPGFPGLTKFSLLQSEMNWPFASLQSLEDEKVGFIMSDPFTLFSEYHVDLPDDIVSDLEVLSPEEVQVWGIITYRTSLLQSTINLQAPVIINIRTWKAAQIILNNPAFSIRQPLQPVTESEAVSLANEPGEDVQQGGQSDVSTNAQKR